MPSLRVSGWTCLSFFQRGSGTWTAPWSQESWKFIHWCQLLLEGSEDTVCVYLNMYIPLDGRGTGERQMGSDGPEAKHSAQHILYMGRIYFLAQFIECLQCVNYLVCVCVCVCVWKSQLSRVLLFCDPMDCGPLGSSVHGIFQAKVLEWVASSFSRGIFRTQDWTQFSHIASRFFTVRDNREVIYCHVANGPVTLQPTATFILSGNLLGPESTWCYATFIGWGPAAAMWAWRWVPWCSRDTEDGFPRASNPLEGETNAGCLLCLWLQFTCYYAHLSVRSGHSVQPTFNGRPWRLGSRITRCLEGGVPHIPSAFGQKILRTTRVVALFCVWYSPRQGIRSEQRHRVLPAEAAAPLALSGGARSYLSQLRVFHLWTLPGTASGPLSM